MNITLQGKPAFGYMHVDLEPGESFVAESDAMASMDSSLEMEAQLNGGLFKGLARKFLGGESLFINVFTNSGSVQKRLTLTQGFPGDVMLKELKDGESFFLQPGAFIACEPSVKLEMKWAGFHSWLGGEGLFRLHMKGSGKFIFGAYGGLLEKEVEGELIVDTDHLVGYPEGFEINTQLSGSLLSSLTSGEGFVMRVKGTGTILVQTRSVSGFSKWVNRNL